MPEAIRSILGLTATLQGRTPSELGVQRIAIIPLQDGAGNELSRFCWAVQVLTELTAAAPPVLVHCQAGWSRSPAVVAGYLMRTQGLTAEKALADIATKRTLSMVPELRALLTRFERECV